MFVAAIWLWPALFAVVERIGQGKLGRWDKPTLLDLLFGAGDWLLYALVTPAIFAIARRWPVARPHVAQRSAIHFAFALFFCLVWATSGKLFQYGLTWLLAPEQLGALGGGAPGTPAAQRISTDVASWLLTTLPFGMVVYVTVAGMAHAIAYFVEAREREIQMARLDEQLTSARYAALQAQLNPHFLFNTLNTLTVLIRDDDRRGAVRIVEHLAAMLRRTLARNQAREIPLGEEIALIEAYVAIERARFPDRLHVDITVPRALRRAAVPPFGIQHLVENAVRHGITKREEMGHVAIEAALDGNTLVVTVSDDGVGISEQSSVADGGIANTRERLAGLYGADASLTVVASADRGTLATLRLPYREVSTDPLAEQRDV